MSEPYDVEETLAPAKVAGDSYKRLVAATQAKEDKIAPPQDRASAEVKVAEAREAWRAFEFDPELKVDNTTGLVYRVTAGGGGFDEDYFRDLVKGGMDEAEAKKLATEEPGKETLVLDRSATAAFKAKKIAEADLSFIKSQAGAVRSWADIEGDKTSEATRKFKDFLARAKAASDIEQADIETNAAKQAFNLNRAKGIESGQFSPFASFYGDTPTQLDGLASIVRKTIPEKIPPDYGLDHVVGLPAYGQGTFQRTLPGGAMPDESGLRNFISGGA